MATVTFFKRSEKLVLVQRNNSYEAETVKLDDEKLVKADEADIKKLKKAIEKMPAELEILPSTGDKEEGGTVIINGHRPIATTLVTRKVRATGIPCGAPARPTLYDMRTPEGVQKWADLLGTAEATEENSEVAA